VYERGDQLIRKELTMKKILFCFVALLLVAGMAYAGGTDIMGQGGFPSDAHKIYRLVRNPMCGTSVVGLTADTVVIWDTVSDDGVTVTLSTTSADTRVAGVVVNTIATADYSQTAANDIGKRNWGYIQTYGLGTVQVSDQGGWPVGATVGCASLETGHATGVVPSTTDVQANGILGFGMDAVAAGASDAEVFIRCE